MVLTEPIYGKTKSLQMWKNVYSFITSPNTQQCEVLHKTTPSENITKFCKQNQDTLKFTKY